MTETEVSNAKIIVEQFFAQGAEKVFLALTEGRFFVGTTPATRIRGTDLTPVNEEITSADQIEEAFSKLQENL